MPVLSRLSAGGAAIAYGVIVVALLAAASSFYSSRHYPYPKPSPFGTALLPDRVRWYETHAKDYNLVFIGDSRTYCGIHPELLDPLLGTSSLNLAIFSHWFPNQLPEIQDVAASVPKGTTVVWSIGSQNVLPPLATTRSYPIGFENAARYVTWGLIRRGIVDNLFYFSRPLRFLAMRDTIKAEIDSDLGRPFDFDLISPAHAFPLNPIPTDSKSADELSAEYLKSPEVAAAGPEFYQGHITSVTVVFKRGSYYRIELDHEFFRRKQRETVGQFGDAWADPATFRIFEAALQTFKDKGINLVVNEIEEAPLTYINRQQHRDFMHNVVEKRVREFGFAYTRVDFDRLKDDDYFDFNHLNSKGAMTFTPMLADALRPYVSKFTAAQ